jgi:hypothetical protein
MSFDLDFTLAAPSGICVDTVGADGVKLWESSVMVPARDLVSSLERIERTLGARYCWESLSDGGVSGREWARILNRVDHWVSCCERMFARRGITDSAHKLVWGDSLEFLDLQVKIEAWKNWGLEPV